MKNLIIKEKRASGCTAYYAMRNGKKVLVGAKWIIASTSK